MNKNNFDWKYIYDWDLDDDKKKSYSVEAKYIDKDKINPEKR